MGRPYELCKGPVMPAPVYSWSFPALLEPKYINADKWQELIVLLLSFVPLSQD